MILLLCAALTTAPQPPDPRDQGVHVAIAAGSGIAFGTLGVHAEVLYGHFALFAGAGVDLNIGDPGSLAAGARLFLSHGEGLMLSLNFSTFHEHRDGDFSTAEYVEWNDLYLGAALGWRFRHSSGLFVESAFGAALLRAREKGFAPYTPSGGFGPGCSNSGQNYSCERHKIYPDIDLALGFEF